jgi:hypothetical protein
LYESPSYKKIPFSLAKAGIGLSISFAFRKEGYFPLVNAADLSDFYAA